MSLKAGVVGLGIMGGAFARNMIKNGIEVVGYDVVDDVMSVLESEGMAAAASPADVAAQVDIVITSLPTPEAFHAVMCGPYGVATAARDGLIVADTCTLALTDKQTAHDALAQRGVILLDCPVSGTGAQAAVADLTVMASGDQAAFQRARPVLEGFARVVEFVGPFGHGSLMKYCANLLVTIHNSSAAEVMVLGQKAGLDLQRLYDVITSGAGTSRCLELRGPMMIANDYETGKSASMKIQAKDMGVISDFIRDHDVPTPLFAAAVELNNEAIANGYDDADPASVCAALEKRAAITR